MIPRAAPSARPPVRVTALVAGLAQLPTVRSAVEQTSPRAWAQRQVRTETGAPFVFTDKPWLRDLWDDSTFRIVLQKATQTGATAWGYVKALHAARMRGETVIYTLPTEDVVADFVKARLSRVIDNSPDLRAATGREQYNSAVVDAVGVKTVGPGIIYWRGCRSEAGALSVPADSLYHDEVDASRQDVLALFEERLSALLPAQKQRYLFSVPSVAGIGINRYYEDSDKREWLVRCTACNRWQAPDYWKHTNGERAALHCTGCDAALDVRIGQWVAQQPDKPIHGYHISRLLLCTPANAAEILGELHRKRLDTIHPWIFENAQLGETSLAGATRLTLDLLRLVMFDPQPYNALTAALPSTGPYYLGCDQGDVLHWVITRRDPRLDGHRHRVVAFGKLTSPDADLTAWNDLKTLITRFAIRFGVIDAMPNKAPARDVTKAYPGRILMCYYNDDQRQAVQVNSEAARALSARAAHATPAPAGTRWDLSVNRTESFDETINLVKGAGVLLPGSATDPAVGEVMQHIKNLVRKPRLLPTGNVVYEWDAGGPDHYAHALNYARIAAEQAELIQQRGTPAPAPVLLQGSTRGR